MMPISRLPVLQNTKSSRDSRNVDVALLYDTVCSFLGEFSWPLNEPCLLNRYVAARTTIMKGENIFNYCATGEA